MKTRLSSIWCILIGSTALAAAAADCGGSSGACGVQACGGDVVGTWHASSACANRALLNQQFLSGIMPYCQGATLGAVAFHPAGSMTFGTDLSYSAAVTMSLTVGINIPSSCLSGQSCAVLTAALQGSVGTGGVQSVSCVGTSSCTCTLTAVSDIENSSGTYTTAGTVLNLYATSGTTSGGGGDYCVKGKALHLVAIDMTMPMATIQSDVVLTMP
jgi:hypothetical protein